MSVLDILEGCTNFEVNVSVRMTLFNSVNIMVFPVLIGESDKNEWYARQDLNLWPAD